MLAGALGHSLCHHCLRQPRGSAYPVPAYSAFLPTASDSVSTRLGGVPAVDRTPDFKSPALLQCFCLPHPELEERVASEWLVAQLHQRSPVRAQRTLQSRKNSLWRIQSQQALRVHGARPQQRRAPGTHSGLIPPPRSQETGFPRSLFSSFAAFCNCHFLKLLGRRTLKPKYPLAPTAPERCLFPPFLKAENAPLRFPKLPACFPRARRGGLAPAGWRFVLIVWLHFERGLLNLSI